MHKVHSLALRIQTILETYNEEIDNIQEVVDSLTTKAEEFKITDKVSTTKLKKFMSDQLKNSEKYSNLIVSTIDDTLEIGNIFSRMKSRYNERLARKLLDGSDKTTKDN